jgi:hypothetical protein
MNESSAESAPRPRATDAVSDDKYAEADDAPLMGDRDIARIVRRSSRTQKRYRRSVRVRALKFLLAATVSAALLVIALMWVYIGNLRTENEEMLTQLDSTQHRVKSLQTMLARVTNERDALVKGRIPALTQLVFDRAIQIRRKYVRNIIFTVTGNQKEHTYEYRIVLSNGSLSVVDPQVKILLFDARGIQIGAASVEKVDATTKTDRIVLDPGETRSYSSSIPVDGKEHPKYFLLQIE